ncbi:hypothetical protein [Roseibium polysiphoniae]|uniref:hypothetical protein n=1 Tax=Roseibium polysiphoniae TaxID=2571221 RepID=UPI003298EE37
MGRKALADQGTLDKAVDIVERPLGVSHKLPKAAQGLAEPFSLPSRRQPHVSVVDALPCDFEGLWTVRLPELRHLVGIGITVDSPLLRLPEARERNAGQMVKTRALNRRNLTISITDQKKKGIVWRKIEKFR